MWYFCFLRILLAEVKPKKREKIHYYHFTRFTFYPNRKKWRRRAEMDKLNTIFVFVSIRPIFSYKMYVVRVCVCVWLCRVREHNLLFCDRRTSFVSHRKNSVYDKVSNVTKCKRKHILTECELMKSFDMNGKWFSSSAMFSHSMQCNRRKWTNAKDAVALQYQSFSPYYFHSRLSTLKT